MWCVSVAWVTLACARGYGGYINDFLSWPAFIPLSRLTFCTYLVHPMILDLIYSGASDTFLNFRIYTSIILFFGAVVLSNIIAAALYLAIEAPVSVLAKIATGGSQGYQHETNGENKEEKPSKEEAVT